MDKVKKWDEINGSGTSEEKMEAFLTDANDTYAILQLRYSDETAHERFESLKGLKRQGIEPTIDHYEVIYVAPLLPYTDRDVMLESLYAVQRGSSGRFPWSQHVRQRCRCPAGERGGDLPLCRFDRIQGAPGVPEA